jgi:four helix bundle protein
MTNSQNGKIYDLEERTAQFGENVIKFIKEIPRNIVSIPLIDQLIRAATSVGANYCEADCAESKKDFEHKLSICKKEAKETKHWLRMIGVAAPELKDESEVLRKEANELQLIFITIVKKSKENRKKG